MPSPRFWKTCLFPLNIEVAIHGTPSPPIWAKPAVSRSIQEAMTWQPMPEFAFDPSGSLVEELCGQPEQK